MFRILVLDRGRTLEFDSPPNLLANTNSSFYKMMAEAELLKSSDENQE